MESRGTLGVVEKSGSFTKLNREHELTKEDVVHSDTSMVSDESDQPMVETAPPASGDPPAAVTADQVLLSCAISCLGREVLVKCVDGETYSGIFSGCNPTEFKVGLEYAYKHPGNGEERYVMSRETGRRKIAFDLKDVVCVIASVDDEKKAFATDEEISKALKDSVKMDDFQQWQEDSDIEEEDYNRHDDKPNASGGWSVDEMFQKNQSLGVQSSFNEDLSQYTTVEPDGDEEARERANKIALEIERSGESKHRALLENDDEERDLDKETTYDDGEFEAVQRRRGGQNTRFVTKTSATISVNGRDNFVRKDSQQGAYNRNNTFNAPGGGRVVTSQTQPRYTGRPQQDRNFSSATDSSTAPQRHFTAVNSGGNGKYTANTTATNESGRPRSNSRTNAAPEQEDQTAGGQKQTGTMGKRANDLRKWGTKFGSEYRESPPGGHESMPPPTATPLASIPTSPPRSQPQNAWNKGPPPFDNSAVTNPMGKTFVASSHRNTMSRTGDVSYQNNNNDHKKKSKGPRRGSDQSSTSRKSSPTNVVVEKIIPIPPKSENSNFRNTEEQPARESEASVSPTHSDGRTGSVEPRVSVPAEPANREETQSQSDINAAKKFEFNPEAPAFVPKKDLTARCSSSTSTLSQTPVPMPPAGIPNAIAVPAMPPPNMMPHPQFIYQPQGVYAMPSMPMYSFPPQAMQRPQMVPTPQQHPPASAASSTSQQQVMAQQQQMQQPTNAPTPSSSGGQMNNEQQHMATSVSFHAAQMGQPQQMMAHSQMQQHPSGSDMQRQTPHFSTMPPNTMFVPTAPPSQYSQPILQGPYQYSPYYAPQGGGPVHNAMPPPSGITVQPMGVPVTGGGVGGQYPLFHHNPSQPGGPPTVTTTQNYMNATPVYPGNGPMQQMGYVVHQNPANVRYVQQAQDYGGQYRS